MADKKRLILIDGHAVVFRAFYAFPHLTGPGGDLVNAVYGFALILLNVIVDLEPTHILVTFDRHEKTFRHEAFEDYKANREETPEELRNQEPLVHELVEALNIPEFSMAGFEADDIIGTLAKQACEDKGLEVVIVTGDKDLLQLVDDECEIRVYIPGRGRNPAVMYHEEQVVEKLGIKREQVADYKGFSGDASDNIPGIKGIGPKTAVTLLSEFGTMEAVYEELGLMKNGKLDTSKVRELDPKVAEDKELVEKMKDKGIGKAVLGKLVLGAESAFASRELATINREVEVEYDLEACALNGYDKAKAIELFDRLGFESLVRRLPPDEFEHDVQEALF